ncbi:MAG: YncE family protein [Spirochaetales bacterium]|nr:YncE family protein [Spirochaetales bacterium]
MSVFRPLLTLVTGAILSVSLTSLAWADSFQVRLRVFPQDTQVFAAGVPLASTPETDTIRDVMVPSGVNRLSFGALGWEPVSAAIPEAVKQGAVWSFKLEPDGTSLHKFAEFVVGRHPRGLAFTPDGKDIIVATTEGLQTYTRRGKPVSSPAQKGAFTDAALVKNTVAALNTDGTITLFPSTIPALNWGSSGKGSLAVLPGGRLAVLGWDDPSVSIIDVAAAKIVTSLKLDDMVTSAAPYAGGLVATQFNEGKLLWITPDGNLTTTSIGGNPRAAALAGSLVWIADMASGKVSAIDPQQKTVLFSVAVGPNPQTLAVSPNGKILAVALRGTNNPENFALQGPDYGQVQFLDAKTGAKLGYVWGRDQPMGLAWSPSGRFLAFTDFLTGDVEVYRISF